MVAVNPDADGSGKTVVKCRFTWGDYMWSQFCVQTGLILFASCDGKEDGEQLISFFEQVALITTLLLTVVAPTYTYAASVCSTVNSHVNGLGTVFTGVCLTSVFANFFCAILCILIIMNIRATSSERQAEMLVKVPPHLKCEFCVSLGQFGLWRVNHCLSRKPTFEKLNALRETLNAKRNMRQPEPLVLPAI